jgi:hypothetical protein
MAGVRDNLQQCSATLSNPLNTVQQLVEQRIPLRRGRRGGGSTGLTTSGRTPLSGRIGNFHLGFSLPDFRRRCRGCRLRTVHRTALGVEVRRVPTLPRNVDRAVQRLHRGARPRPFRRLTARSGQSWSLGTAWRSCRPPPGSIPSTLDETLALLRTLVGNPPDDPAGGSA